MDFSKLIFLINPEATMLLNFFFAGTMLLILVVDNTLQDNSHLKGQLSLHHRARNI